MPPAIQFSEVAYDRGGPVSFALGAKDVRLLDAASKEEKAALIELALGERTPDHGTITVNGWALDAAPPGSVGWVPAQGGLISNLKTWENVTLPLWYHGRRSPARVEERLRHLLLALALDSREWEQFMASPSGRLSLTQRKLVGLLRGLLLSPTVLVIDASLFDGLEQHTWHAWVAAVSDWAHASEGAALVVTERKTSLPWAKVE